MTAKPRTIDNLGIDASIRYAKDQQLFEASQIEESRLIPQKTEVVSSAPWAFDEFSALFAVGVEKRSSWALFPELPQDISASKSLFSHQLIPSLGREEKVASDAEKLEKLEALLQKEGTSSTGDQEDAKKLINLLQCLRKFDKILQLINGRRGQYQKG
ncbi:MAG: DUF5399 family protein [Verrucomicrobiota bacterium]|nr:DUF5399 family protein [Verrucomicrobiota bacterium]